MRIDELLARWHDGSLGDEELRELTALLELPENRDRLLDDWLIESALPDVLRVCAIASLAPEPSWLARIAGVWSAWMPPPLPLWSRCSLAAVPVGAAMALAVNFLLPAQPTELPLPRDPALIAQRLLETQLPDSP